MIGWLQGRLADPWQQGGRCGALVVCHGVGYEVHLGLRQWQDLPPSGGEVTLHVHHSMREDAATLYGFPQRRERDLFRELVTVSGVGPQMALALLGSLPAREVVRAIVQADLRCLSQAPGVGRRTAERLSVELRQRLQERFAPLLAAGELEEEDGEAGFAPPEGPLREEVQGALGALGYEPLEIHRALRAVAAPALADSSAEEWLGACLRWLAIAAA